MWMTTSLSWSRYAETLRRAMASLAIAAIASLASAGCLEDDTAWDQDAVGDQGFPIKNANPVAPTDLTGMVNVDGASGTCSGMMISETAALTAAHCVCTESYVGGNVCTRTATVRFRPSPSGQPGGSVTGSAVWHPGYNPSWLEGLIEHDLAVVTIPLGSMPSHVVPFRVASAYQPIGTQAMVAGFGYTGSDCSGPLGTLNWDLGAIDSYEDDGYTVAMQDDEWCGGDSGGAVLAADGTLSPNKLIGVISSTHPIWGTSKATATWSHHAWIMSQVIDPTDDLLWGGPGWAIWTTSDGTYLGGTSGAVNSQWGMIGAGDFNGDGWSDILWRHYLGDLHISLMREGTNFASFTYLPVPTNDWVIRAIADVNGDRIADLVFHNAYSGEVYVWTMGETGQPIGYGSLGIVTGGWRITGTGDFDHDGKADLFWTLRSPPASTQTAIWLLNGTSVAGYRSLSPATIPYTYSFKGIGSLRGTTYKDDIVWRNSDGTVLTWQYSWVSGSVISVSQVTTGWAGNEWDLRQVADISGDGISDYAWFRSSDRRVEGWLLNAYGGFGRSTFLGYADPGWTLRASGKFN
jgi:V8-like Glu-specific endopeptidase